MWEWDKIEGIRIVLDDKENVVYEPITDTAI